MSVAEIGYKNRTVSYPQQSVLGRGGKTQGMNEEFTYGEEMAMQGVAPAFTEQPLDYIKADPGKSSGENVQAYNAYLVERGNPKSENVGKQAEAGGNTEQDFKRTMKDSDFRIEEASLTSGLIGFGSFEDGTKFSARYADHSTEEDPIVEVKVVNESGTEIVVNVKVNEIDPENATELEMLAFLTHLDEQGTSGNDKFMGSYQDLMYRAKNSQYGDASAHSAQDFIFQRKDWRSMTLSMTDFGSSAAQALAEEREKAQGGVPYSYLAKDGIIDYKGVIFVCDEERRAICLGDTSNMNNCIRIGLSGGGCLIVNRANLGDLAAAIGMFSPEDVNLILRAIAEDAKIQQMKQQIDDETSGIDLVDSTQENSAEGEAAVESLGDVLFGENGQGMQETAEQGAEKGMQAEVSAQKEKK